MAAHSNAAIAGAMSKLSLRIAKPKQVNVSSPIQAIPAEVLDAIFQHVYDDLKDSPRRRLRSDRQKKFIALGSVSKQFRESSVQFLYRELDALDYEIVRLMRAIAKYPERAQYIQYINLSAVSVNSAGAPSQEECAIFPNATMSLQEQADLFAAFSEAFHEGQLAVKVVMLCLLCPNLRRLKVRRGGHNSNPEHFSSQDVVWLGKMIEFFSNRKADQEKVWPFEKLRSVDFVRDVNCPPAMKEAFWAAASASLDLPSIKRVKFSGAGGTFPPILLSKTHPPSNVQELALNSSFSAQAISFILRRCKILSSLTIAVISSVKYDCIMEPLLGNKSTLKHLDIQAMGSRQEWSGFGPLLLNFKNLKTLALDEWMIGGSEVDDDMQRLQLPHLEALSLRTSKHPRTMFTIIGSLLAPGHKLNCLDSLSAEFTIQRTDCVSFLKDELLAYLEFSSNILDLKASLETTLRGFPTHAIATISVKHFQFFSKKLKQYADPWILLGELRNEALPISESQRRLLRGSVATKDLLLLRDSLDSFRTHVLPKETRQEYEARHERMELERYF